MTDKNIDFESAKAYLPPGLSSSELSDLYEDLQRIDQGLRYFSPHAFDFHLQGDTFEGAPYVVVSVDSLTERKTRVMVLSNTCDIDRDNARRVPINVTVAPLTRVSTWCSLMARFEMSESAIESKLISIKQHKVSSIFFLPKGQGVDEESLVLLDKMQSMPIARFDAARPTRLATLSQSAFWLLLVKISIHFCRQQEGVSRQST